MKDPRESWTGEAPPFSYSLASTATMFAAVLLFFCAGILIVAATISGPAPWIRVLLVVGGAVVLVPMCYLGRVAGRRLRVDLRWMISGGPPSPGRPRSRDGREAHRLISSALPVPASPALVRFARLAFIPSSPPWLVRGYALATAGPVGLVALALGYLAYAGLDRTVSGAAAGLLPVWVLIPFQVIALIGAMVVVVQMPRPAPAGTGLRLRSYAFIWIPALVAVLLERDAGSNAVIGIVAGASLIVLIAADAGVATARRTGHGRNG